MESMNNQRMDAGQVSMSAKGQYTIPVGNETIGFHGADLAPASAVFAINYAWCGLSLIAILVLS